MSARLAQTRAGAMRRAPWTVLLLLALAAGVAQGAEEPRPRLHFDPFVRPQLGARPGAEGVAALTPARPPALSATLVDGADSLATLGGVVLRVGEEAHGFRLKQVRRFEAVFERNGAEVVIPVGRDGRSAP